jgi:DNA-directed RNA polymerase subunit alpha
MGSVAEAQVSLFGEVLPSLSALEQLSRVVQASEANLMAFAEEVQKNVDKTDAASCLAVGIGLFILGRDAEAVQKLQKAKGGKEKFMYLAFAHCRLGNFDQALECLDQAKENQAEGLAVALEKAATLREAERLEQAAKEIQSCASFERVSAQYHFQLARLQEVQGVYEQAIENYKVALELDPADPKTLFHLAFASDLRGDEDAAIDYYKQLVSTSPTYVSALLNLAVLYEDKQQYDRASRCVDKVLGGHPNHPRAMLFKKDIESSKTMVYDEEKEKRHDRRIQLLETPLTDFELSVRSRNCLKKMNIITIGDLLNITEVELLSYKNFGETSLSEIKSILESKGLRLGMAREEKGGLSDILPEEITKTTEDILRKSVDELDLCARSQNCLRSLNVLTIGELITKTEAELLGCKNFGVTSLNETKQRLAAYGLSLRKLP